MKPHIVQRPEKDGTVTDVYLDENGRKMNTIRKRPDGTTRATNEYSYPLFSKTTQAESCVQTLWQPDGTTPSSQFHMIFDEKAKKFAVVKQTAFDERGRKEETVHFDGDKNRTHINRYHYRGTEELPAGGERIDFYPGTTKPSKIARFQAYPKTRFFFETAWTTYDIHGKEEETWVNPDVSQNMPENTPSQSESAKPGKNEKRPAATFLHRLKSWRLGKGQ